MDQRYIVTPLIGTPGKAYLLDTLQDGPVLTGRGDMYIALIEDVQWAARTMNRQLADHTDPVLADSMSGDPVEGRAPRHAGDPAPERGPINYPRLAGRLEGELHSLRALVYGMLAGMDILPADFTEMRADVAVRHLLALGVRLDEIVESFPPNG